MYVYFKIKKKEEQVIFIKMQASTRSCQKKNSECGRTEMNIKEWLSSKHIQPITLAK